MVPPNAPTVTITVHQGRNLVAKDKNLFGKKTTSDPYVILYVGKRKIGTTKIKPKTLAPTWNESFTIPFEQIFGHQQQGLSQELSPEHHTVTLIIFDHDKLASDDCMGSMTLSMAETTPPTWHAVQKGTEPNFCKNPTGELQVSITVQKPVEIKPGNAIPVRSSKVSVGLAWELDRNSTVDLDAACVALDRDGQIILDDTVYYGHLSNANESIVHSGDERTGETVGDDETITLQLHQIPSKVLALYFILSVATPAKTLEQVKSARVNIYRGTAAASQMPLCQFFPANIGAHSTMFLARLARDASNEWMLCPIEAGDMHARDFGSIIPHIKGFTRDLLPNIEIDAGERIAVLHKGGIIRLRDFGTQSFRKEMEIDLSSEAETPKTYRRLSFGLAWDVTDGVNIDLDASILCLDANLNHVDTVSFSHLTSKDGAIQHSGDQRSGEAAGDDETIHLHLDRVDRNISYLGVTINSYSGQELDDIQRASCHLYDSTSKRDIATYSLTNAKELDKYTALLVGCLYRTSHDGEWMLRLISEAAHGTLAKDLVDELQRFLRQNPAGEPEDLVEPEIDLSYAMPAFKPVKEDVDIVL